MASEVRVTASVVIRRPLVEVFDKVCSVEGTVDWVPFCESARIVQRSSEPEAYEGIGPGMEGMFDFGMRPALRLQVRQKIIEFEWGRKIGFSTTRSSTEMEYGANILSRLVAPLIPRTVIRFEFEPTHAGTVLTVEVMLWVLSFGGSDIGRPVVADSLLQALSGLKHHIEKSQPAQFSPWIFFNYRRSDAEFATDRIYDALKHEFGEGASFRDLYHVGLGTELADELRKQVHCSRVFLAVIGPGWLAELNRRAEASSAFPETDWVLEELAMALGSKETLVIPLLIGATPLPRAEELPEKVRGLVTLNGLRIRRDPDFEKDLDRLKRDLWAALRSRGAPGLRRSMATGGGPMGGAPSARS